MRDFLKTCESKEQQSKQLNLTGKKKEMFLEGYKLSFIIEILGGVE